MSDNLTYCACSSEWCGATCEVIHTCNNGGTCEAHATTEVTCKCVAKFTGQTCEDVIREASTGEESTGEESTGEDATGEESTG